MLIINKLSRHLDESGLTYAQHMVRAVTIFFHLTAASLCVLIHAIFPFMFETTASDIMKTIQKKYTC